MPSEIDLERKRRIAANQAAIVAIKQPLPDGLKALVMELEFKPVPWRRKIDKGEIDYDEELFQGVLGYFGRAEWVNDGSASIFRDKAEKGLSRCLVSIIASHEVIERWFKTPDGYTLPIPKETNHIYFTIFAAKVIDSLADSFATEKWETDYLYIRDGEPQDFECPAEWLRENQVRDSDLEQLAQLRQISNDRIESMGNAIARRDTRHPANSFLVPGLIPDGVPTLGLGNKKAGKSTAFLEFCVAVARREPEWMGFPLNHDRRGFAVYLAGEDSVAEVMERVKLMTGGDIPLGLYIISAGADLDAILEDLKRENVRLLVIDPARKFFKGDEDGSDQVSDLFNRIEPFTKQKNCATILSHHLKRGSSPRSVAEVGECVRGSGVWLDRPRVTLGIVRVGDETHFGISGPPDAPLHNFRRSIMFSGVRRLRRDDATSRHVPIDREQSAASSAVAVTSEEMRRVVTAIEDLTKSGRRITSTGGNELFKHSPLQVKGWSRAKVRHAVKSSIDAGLLTLKSDGSITVPLHEPKAEPGDATSRMED